MSTATMKARYDTAEPTHICATCGAGIRGDRYLCPGCTDATADGLRAYWYREPTPYGLAPNLLDELQTTVTRQARTAPSNDGSRPTERPLPFSPHAATVLDSDIHYLLSRAHRYGAPPALIRGRNGTACARWLYTALNAITLQGDSGLFASSVADRWGRAMVTIDRPADTWYAGKCLQCSADLYALDGATRIDCEGCGASHDVAAQRARLLDAVEDTLATAHEICRAVHLLDRAVTRSQIDNWYSRGQLLRRGRSLGGHYTYRVGDVLDLVAKK